jgi:dihydroorotate dehydrogenase (fumarate)
VSARPVWLERGFDVGAIDLSTSYLGLTLQNPFIAGASPLGAQLDSVRRLEDAGCAAIVLHSLFEEQITQFESDRIHEMDTLDPQFAAVVAQFPSAEGYPLTPEAYLAHLQRVKAAVRIPIIASLNGTSPHAWLKFASAIEQAGADALELNTYAIATDADEPSIAIEAHLRQMVEDLRRVLRIPISVKLSPFYTAFAHLARSLEKSGASGLVIFNRFLQPDIDLAHMSLWPRLELSDSSELLLRLRWLAILRGQLRCSLAATGGVATADDGIKAILAGADAVQLVSAVLRNGFRHFGVMRDGLVRWMESREISSLDAVRGQLSLAHADSAGAVERGHYIRTLSSWSSWLAYQAYMKAHKHSRPMPS